MAVIRKDLTMEKLIGKDSISAYSPWIVISEQHTVVAVGLTPEMEVHFEIAVIKSGKLGEIKCCSVTPPTMSDIERTERLLCPTCPACDREYMRLTSGSQFMILDVPKGAAIRAVLVDAETTEPIEDLEDIHSVDVFTYIDTDSVPYNDAQRGCPPKADYTPTYKFPFKGLGFRSNDRFIDPKASVILSDCDGSDLVRIYPTPQPYAGTEITSCDGELLGYAVDSNHGEYPMDCALPKKIAVQIVESCGKTQVLYNDGTVLTVKN